MRDQIPYPIAFNINKTMMKGRKRMGKKDGIVFECPHCTILLKAEQHIAGSKGKCPKCEKTIEIPKESMNAS